jgi:hypothetical protein
MGGEVCNAAINGGAPDALRTCASTSEKWRFIHLSCGCFTGDQGTMVLTEHTDTTKRGISRALTPFSWIVGKAQWALNEGDKHP